MENSKFIKKINDKSIEVLKGATVPEKNTFIVQDANGKLVNTLKGGAPVPAILDCVLIDCPPEFSRDTICWKCKERPAETQPVRR